MEIDTSDFSIPLFWQIGELEQYLKDLEMCFDIKGGGKLKFLDFGSVSKRVRGNDNLDFILMPVDSESRVNWVSPSSYGKCHKRARIFWATPEYVSLVINEANPDGSSSITYKLFYQKIK